MSDRVLPTAGCQLSSVDLSNNQRRRMANPAIKMDDYAAIKDMVCTKCIIGTKISYLHALNFLNGTEKLETKSSYPRHDYISRGLQIEDPSPEGSRVRSSERSR